MEHLLKRELKPHLILTVGIYQIVFISGKQLFSPVNRNPAPLAPQPGQESLSPDSEWPPWETHSPPQATQPEFLAFFFFLIVSPHVYISLNSVVSFWFWVLKNSTRWWQSLWLALSLNLSQPCASKSHSSLLAHAAREFIHSQCDTHWEPDELMHVKFKFKLKPLPRVKKALKDRRLSPYW